VDGACERAFADGKEFCSRRRHHLHFINCWTDNDSKPSLLDLMRRIDEADWSGEWTVLVINLLM